MIKVIERITRKGQKLEIGISEDGNWIEAYLDGKYITGKTGIGKAQLHNMGAEFTHQLGPVLMTSAEAEAIEMARPAVIEAHRQTPEGLRIQRQQLCDTIRGILDDRQSLRDWAQDTGVMDDLPIPSYDSPEYRKAKQELADFDAAHPEIIEALERERKARLDAHIWD